MCVYICVFVCVCVCVKQTHVLHVWKRASENMFMCIYINTDTYMHNSCMHHVHTYRTHFQEKWHDDSLIHVNEDKSTYVAIPDYKVDTRPLSRSPSLSYSSE